VTDVHGKTITYSYNDCGLRSGWTDQFSGSVSFSYSNMHALTSLTDRNSEQTSYQYDTGGRLTKITLANSAYTDYAYNNRNFVTSVTNKKSDATVISSYTYQYDSAGNPTKMTEANGDYTDYGYDNIYQLASEVMKDSGGTTIYSISWTYDNVGNRATQTKDGNQTSYTYNNMNQMSAAGNTTFTYDSNGNTASKTESQATTNYTWNYQNALTKIDNPSGDDYVYEYDGDGMRVRGGHDSGQGNVWDTRFYYDTGAPLYSYLFESDNDKTMTVAYTVDPYADLISQRRNSATYYHLYDQLGSTRKLLDSNQAVTDAYSYYVFGDVRTSSGSTTNAFKFVGRLGYCDDRSTDFQYLRARYYRPADGTFLSPDDRGAVARRYHYVLQRAVTGGDPSGRTPHRWGPNDGIKFRVFVTGCHLLGPQAVWEFALGRRSHLVAATAINAALCLMGVDPSWPPHQGVPKPPVTVCTQSGPDTEIPHGNPCQELLWAVHENVHRSQCRANNCQGLESCLEAVAYGRTLWEDVRLMTWARAGWWLCLPPPCQVRPSPGPVVRNAK
jgi:RHS repeat-associated protein